MRDRKQIVAVPLEAQLSTARTEGTPLPRFEFGPDDPRIDLICPGCEEVFYSFPPGYQFDGPTGDVIACGKCGVQNDLPLSIAKLEQESP